MIRLNILYYFTVKTEVNQSETEMLNISSMHIRKYYKKGPTTETIGQNYASL